MNGFTLLDGFLSKLFLFFVGALVGGFYCHDYFSALVFAVIFSLCVGEIYLIAVGKRKKLSRNKKDDVILSALVHSPSSDIEKSISSALSLRFGVSSNEIIIINDCAVFCAFSPSPLSSSEVKRFADICHAKSLKKTIILCNSADPTVDKFISAWSGERIIVLDGDKTIDFLTRLDALPKIKVPSKRENRLTLLRSAISKERARAYFVSGFIMIAFSAFVTRSIYFVVFGALSISLGILSLVLFSKKV